MACMCGDNRFKVIAKAKEALLQETNIESSPKEMEVLDDFLFRCWQMGWLSKYEPINEKELDKLAEEYTTNECEFDNEWKDSCDAFKAGYRKAKGL